MESESSDAVSEPQIVKQGILLKRGEHIRTWRSRYFILKDDGSFTGYRCSSSMQGTSSALTSTPSVNSSASAGLLQLNDFTVRGCDIARMDRPRPYGFVIRGLHTTSAVVRMFCVQSERERESWIEEIQRVRDALDPPRRTIEQQLGPIDSVKKRTLADFDMIKVLGKGGFGTVLLCREKSSGGRVHAIKIMRKEVVANAEQVANVLAENVVLKKISHPFLLELRCAFTTPDNLCLVTEFASGGDLYTHLSRQRRLPEDQGRLYGAEITLALRYLHARGIVYRDLKLENVLLAGDGHVKLADFGLCKENMGGGRRTASYCGTPGYLAPEVISGGEYGLAVDWWGLGVALFEMMVGRMPFGNDADRDPASVNFRTLFDQPQYPGWLSPDARSLLEGLLAKEPEDRFDADKVIRHDFFDGINWDDVEAKKIGLAFVPELTSATDTRYFSAEFTSLSLELTPPSSECGDTYSMYSWCRSCNSEVSSVASASAAGSVLSATSSWASLPIQCT